LSNLLTGHQQSALDIKNNIALTANAGSGKTFVLSKRFLEIALSENIPLRKIAAITFTEKAASELYKKIAAQVEILLSGNDEVLNNKLRRIRRSLVSANISTIHSFCINLLREYPVEAEIDANFIPVDTNISYELTELAVEEIIKAALLSAEDSGKIKSLIRLFGSKRNFSNELINLIGNRKNILELKNKIYDQEAEHIADYFFKSFLRIVCGYLSSRLPEFIAVIEKVTEDVLAADPCNKIAIETHPLINKLKNSTDTEATIEILYDLQRVTSTKEGTLRKLFIKKLSSANMKIIFYQNSFLISVISRLRSCINPQRLLLPPQERI
jgi:ATP-dependent helicase/nuclease subunit A